MSVQLRAEFKAALAEAEVLKGKPDRSDDDVARFKELAENVLPSLKGRIETHESVDAFNLDDYSVMTAKAVGTPFSGGRAAGSIRIGENGETEDIGPGALTAKQFDAIAKPEYAKAYKAFLYYGEDKVKNNYPSVYKTLVSGIDDGAGYFVPPDMLAAVIQRKPAPTTLRGRVRQITTSSNRVNMLRTTFRDNIYTSPINGQWTGEAGNPDESAEPRFGEVQIAVHEYMGRLRVSNTLLEDSGFQLESYLSQELGTWLDLHYEKHLAYGTGIGQPKGIWNSVTSSATGVSEAGKIGWVESGTIGKIDADTVKSMRFEILPQYARSNFSFIMNQMSAKAISLLKDTNGSYLFQRGQYYPGIVEPTPDAIDGFPISYCQFAPEIATGNFPILFGSLEGYFMPVRLGLSMRVLNEIEAVNNRRVYLFRLRWGGEMVQDELCKFIKIK